jgi:hypothetical protein
VDERRRDVVRQRDALHIRAHTSVLGSSALTGFSEDTSAPTRLVDQVEHALTEGGTAEEAVTEVGDQCRPRVRVRTAQEPAG